MNKNKVVVTGGAGFIGSHLAEGLAKCGYQVTILDNLSTGKMENIEGLINNPSVEFIQGNINDLDLLQKAFKGARYIFHQAALPSVPRSVENPLASNDVNLNGTLNVLIAARDNKVEKVIYASSSSVYGDTPTLPKNEDMTPNPLSPYAVSKLAGEYYCRVFQSVYGLPTVCLRYFNVFGPRQDPESPYAAVIPLFIKKALSKESPVIYEDGEQTRDFTFVKDVIAANIVLAESNACGIFNISRQKSVTVNHLAELIIELTGNNIAPVYHKERPGDIRHSLADISKARGIGFQPAYDLKAGLTETIEWFSNG